MAKSMAGFLENPVVLFTMLFDVVINTSLKLSLALASRCVYNHDEAVAMAVVTDNRQQSTKSGSGRNGSGSGGNDNGGDCRGPTAQ